MFHHFSSPNDAVTSQNVATCLPSAQPGPFVLSTRGEIQQPVMVGKPQASVMWLSAPPPPPPPRPSPAPKPPQRSWMETQEALSAGRASAQRPPAPPHQSSGNLAASDCKYLRVAGRPWCYWQLITGSIIQKEEKKKIKLSGWSGSVDVGDVRIYTHLSLTSLFLCSNTSCRQDSLLC